MTVDRAEELLDLAAGRIRDRGGSAAVSFSGGKDSIVAAAAAERAGVTRGVLVRTAGLEYPALDQWTVDTLLALFLKPTVETRPLDLDWLRAHPTMLFPLDSGTSSKWYALVQHAGQRAYASRLGIETLVMGRRLADGNYCGKGGLYRDRVGFDRLSPIYDFSHEDVLGIIAALGLPMAPCYAWPRGYRVGTGPWAKRRAPTREQAWSEVAAIDPGIIAAAAAAGIPGAEEHLP